MKHDVRVTLRMDDAGRDVLTSRAKNRGIKLSEYLRRLILVGLSVEAGLDEAETKQNLRRFGGKTVIGTKRNVEQFTTTRRNQEPVVEHRERKSDTQRRVDDVLASKGFKEKPAKKRSPFRADGHHR